MTSAIKINSELADPIKLLKSETDNQAFEQAQELLQKRLIKKLSQFQQSLVAGIKEKSMDRWGIFEKKY